MGNCPGGELSKWGIVLVGSCPIAGSHPGGELSYSGESSWWGVVL